jgi:hypothetical protein
VNPGNEALGTLADGGSTISPGSELETGAVRSSGT